MNCEQIRRDEWATRYLRGELGEAERDTFEMHYFGCERCFGELEALRITQGELARQASAIRAEAHGRETAKGWRWIWVAVPALAAGVAMVAVLTWMRPEQSPIEQAKQTPAPPTVSTPAATSEEPLVVLARYEPPAYQETFLRGAAPSENFRKAMAAYQRKDWEGALQLLGQEPNSDARASFYRGACELLTQNAQEAIADASRVIALGETPYLEEAYFLRAKAQLHQRHSAEAIADLEKLAALHGDWEARARQLLKQVRELPR